MKKTAQIFTLFLATFLIGHALAAETGKIAVLDMQLVMNGTTMAKNKLAQLKKRSEDAQKRFVGLEEDFKKRVGDLERKKSILSEEKYMQEQSELRRIGRERQAEFQTMDEKLSREYKSVQKEIGEEVGKVIKNIAKERGFDVIIAKNYLLYSAHSIDISKDVLMSVEKTLKKKSRKKGL